MDTYSTAPTYDEDPAFYDYQRVNYVNMLEQHGDHISRMSGRKPSLSEYDEAP